MILTVTLNAGIDVTYHLEQLGLGETCRVRDQRERAGGKGVNVARVLRTLGHDVTSTGFAGADTKVQFADELAGDGVVDEMVTVDGRTRRTVTLVEDDGRTTVLNEPGAAVTRSEWTSLVDRYERMLPDAQLVVLSGSVPPGLPVDPYGDLIARAKAADCPVLLDTSGDRLRTGIRAAPDVVVPNQHELAELIDGDVPAGYPYAVARGAQELRSRGASRVVVTLGRHGLVGVGPDGAHAARTASSVHGNPTGAGDALVAGLCHGWQHGWDCRRVLEYAVACGAAAVAEPVAGSVDRAVVERELSSVSVTGATDVVAEHR